MQLKMPYRPPLDLPLHWQDEQSGKLSLAVLAYMEEQCSDEQLEYTRAYCEYYILAPCWDRNIQEGDTESPVLLRAAREQIKAVKTHQGLLQWIHKCLEMGIDPL